MDMPLVRFGSAGAKIKFPGELRGTRAILRKISGKKRKKGIYTNVLGFALISSLQQHSSKEATHPFPSKASSDGDARRVPISTQLVLSLHASLRLPSDEKMIRIFGCPCISASNWYTY